MLRSACLVPVAILLFTAAAHAQTIITGHHDNDTDGEGYIANAGLYLVPADTGTSLDATFNNNGQGLDTSLSIVVINGGQFNGNVLHGLYALDSTLTVTGGQFNGNGVIGLLASDYVTANISGGQFDGNGKGIYADNLAVVTVTGGTFGGNGIDFYSVDTGSIRIYGQFNGLTPGQTRVLAPFNGTFTGTLASENVAQTFTYYAYGGTITLYDIAPAPEPSSVAALAIGTLSLGALALRARKHSVA